MAANLKASQPSGKQNITVTKHDALEVLQSALSICQQAGLVVQAKNVNPDNRPVLIIGLPGVAINGNDLVLIGGTP